MKFRPFYWFSVFLILSAFPCWLMAQPQAFERMTASSQQCHPNLASLYFDSKDRLWIGTAGGGICVYDGRTIERAAKRPDEDHGPGYFISSIVESGDGTIWVLSDLGVSRYYGHNWQLDTMTQLMPGARLINHRGRILLWTGRTILEYESGKTNHQWKLSSLSRPGTELVFPIDDKSLLYLAGGQVTLTDATAGETVFSLPGNIRPENVTGAVGSRSLTYLATASEGIMACPHGNCAQIPGFSGQPVSGMVLDGSGQLWFYTDKGALYTYSAGSISRIEGPDSYGKIVDLALDDKGSLWLGMNNGDIYRHLSDPFRLVNLPGSESNRVHRLYLDEEDNIWVADSQGEVWRFAGARPEPMVIDSGTVEGDIADFTRFGGSGYLFMTVDGRVHLYDEATGITPAIYQLDTAKTWLRLARDQLRTIWFLSDSDIHRASYSLFPGFPYLEVSINACGWDGPGNIRDIHIDRRNRAWWHTGNAVGWYQNGQFSTLEAPVFFRDITCWSEDDHGFLWIGTSGAGMYVVDLYQGSPEMMTVQTGNSARLPLIRNIHPDQDQVFVSTGEMIYRYQVDRDTRRISGEELVGNVRGFPGLALMSQAMQIDRFGQIFVGTNQGVLWVKQAAGNGSAGHLPPKTYFKQIEVNFSDLYNTQYAPGLGAWNQQLSRIRFRPGDNDLHFVFSAANYHGNRSLQYQWRLFGSGSGWSVPTSQNEVYFPDLAPGSYRFAVRACRHDGRCNGEPSEFAFQIIAPWYQRWWFFAGIALLLAGVLGYLVSQRNRRMMQQYLQEREKMRLENKALDLQRKALQLQMNPHFLFNAMNTIQSEISAESLEAAKVHLARFARLMRQVLESSREETTSLDEEIELLDNYIAIASLSRGIDIRFEVHVSENVEPEMVEIPSMMVQPFVENAIQHGFKGMDSGEISLHAQMKGRNLLVEITDDGHGYPGGDGVKPGSVAIQVIRERLKMMKRPGQVTIRQWHPDATKRKGTQVILKLPVE